MAITKRTRFEILRRDEHTCQYCGEKAPDVVLHVDHVIPVALGGSDKPDNLVTACKDCNTGKTSIAPDSPLAERVADLSLAYAAQMEVRMAVLRNELQAEQQYVTYFEETWMGTPIDYMGKIGHLPDDWQSLIRKWFKMGVPVELLDYAMGYSLPNKNVTRYDKFRYMAGIVWAKIREAEAEYSEVGGNFTPVFTKDQAEELASERATAAWALGYDKAKSDAVAFTEDESFEIYSDGFSQAEWQIGIRAREMDFLAHVIDGTTSEPFEGMKVGSFG